MKALEKYKRATPIGEKRLSTSVSISEAQKRFLDSQGLNLSDMVRDMLTEAMQRAGFPTKLKEAK